VKYGEHAFDQWSVDEVLSLATGLSLAAHQSTEAAAADKDR